MRKLQLSGCSTLEQLLESLAELTALRIIRLARCSSLSRLPAYMDRMKGLKKLDISFCHSLDALPRHMPASLQLLDLSYCRHADKLAEQLVDLAEQMPNAKVVLKGWGALGTQQHDQTLQFLFGQSLRGLVPQLRTETTVKRLLTDSETIISSLERLSWLAVLLAATTFTAAVAPPGGYNSGLLFLPYSNAGCRVSSSSSGSSGSSGISSSSVGAQDINGSCIQAPDTCSDGLACRAQVSANRLRAFFVLDLLSFGFSMALVLFVVACSMSRKIGVQSARYAGLYMDVTSHSFAADGNCTGVRHGGCSSRSSGSVPSSA
uniref:PGG domain-containing protein n=1 Tax=Tetradesmus obliquus TaxID=3088 RepID=A0A383V1J9_TETOB|eukprot:jgi/Sobl393_1/4551/SZX59437.1